MDCITAEAEQASVSSMKRWTIGEGIFAKWNLGDLVHRCMLEEARRPCALLQGSKPWQSSDTQ